MSGIIGSINLRSSGLVNLGSATDGQVFTGTGVGLPVGFEAAAGGGKVVKVLSTVKTSVFTTGATSLTDVTGMSQAITPASASNKILVWVCGMGSNTSGGQACEYSLLRGTTEIFIGDASGSRSRRSAMSQQTATYVGVSFSIVFLDSPSTTSSTTYKLQMAAQDAGTAVFGRDGNDGDESGRCRFPGSITCMEIDGT